MSKVFVEEMRNGNVRISSRHGEKVYEPNYDFSDALNKYYLITEDAKDMYDDGYDWFSCSQYFLLQKVIWPYVAYRDVLEILLSETKPIKFNKKGKVFTLYEIFRRKGRWDRLKFFAFAAIERSIQYTHNRFVTKLNGILFFRYSVNDYRVEEVASYLKESERITYVSSAGVREWMKFFFRDDVLFVLSNRFFVNVRGSLDVMVKATLESLVRESKKQKKAYDRLLNSGHNLKGFVGIDDVLFIHPLLFSLKEKSIVSVGFQHGLYGRKSIGYAVESGRKNYAWFDFLVVWDTFWKKVFLTNNSNFEEEKIFVGVKSEFYNFRKTNNPKNRTVLVMYESFVDLDDYRNFMKGLTSKGFKLVVKLRPGVSIEEFQNLYEIPDKVETVYEMTQDLIDRVSVVLGAKTSLLYHLLTANRPIWILETQYHYLDEVLELSEVVRLAPSDIDNIEEIYDYSVNMRLDFEGAKEISSVGEILGETLFSQTE